MTRYHPLLVALHWLLAILILLALFGGSQMLAPMSNADPGKIGGLAGHMAVGMAIGALLVARLITRLTTQHPPHADAGNALLNLAGRAAHLGLYLLSFLMVASGIGIALSAGLPDIVYGGSGAPLPETFDIYPPRAVHGISSKLLFLLILAHIAGWLYHALLVKDRLLARMWFGKRSGN